MKNRFIRTALFTLALDLVFTLTALSAAADDYARVRTYAGQFADVPGTAWYYNNVAQAYELGLVNGKSETSFDPDGTLTIAETIKLASVCNQLLAKGAVDDSAFAAENASAWYDGYVAYAAQRDIVTETYENYNAPATRGMVAVLFSRAISNAGANMPEINEAVFGSLADVPTSAWYATSAYRLYRWGIMAGDENGLLHPESSIRRSEMSAVVTRVVDPSLRMRVSAAGTSESPAVTVSAGELVLYEGTNDPESVAGLTGFAADFSAKDGGAGLNASYSLDLVNHVALERDNISFRLRQGSGYEALSALREKLEAAAVGANGTVLRSGVDVYPAINELIYLWADGSRVTISGLWYADHEDYTTYAFYFDEALDPSAIGRCQLVCGTPGSDTLRLCGLDDLAVLVDKAYGVQADDSVVDAETPVNNEQYLKAIEAAKSTATEIPFEYESDRCYILYGAGLYGTASDDYRLLFIFRDGTSQTVCEGKLKSIRVNSAGSVLYYTVTAPDGKEIQHGVNFD